MSMIFIVVDGCYSDYGIRAVFSTREKAQVFIDEHAAPWNGPGYARTLDAPAIEEWDMDAEAPPERCQRFAVTLDHEGGTVYVGTVDRIGGPLRSCQVFYWTKPWDRSTPVFTGVLWAKDADHAVKSARDRRAASIAAGEGPQPR